MSQESIQERFETKFERHENGCWEWTGARTGEGYGSFWIDGKTYKSHRLSYEFYIARIPDSNCVLHHCDNRACVRPDHLWLGSVADNNADMITKGHQVRGETVGTSKLTDQQVVAMREERLSSGALSWQLAEKYGAKERNVRYILRKDTWKHV